MQGVEISNIFLTNVILKDLIQLTLIPGGGLPVWENLQWGICILNNLPTSAQLVSETPQKEKNLMDTKSKCTHKKAEKVSKKDRRKPAGNYDKLLKNVTRYVMFILALFGD